MQVVLTFDDAGFQDLLNAWQEPAVKRTLGAASSAWGRNAKTVLKIFTPDARPGNAYAKGPGNLRDLTKSKRIKRSLGIGVVVAPMGKGAYYRRWVVGGTKPHLILPKSQGGKLRILAGYATAVHHPGARPNDYVARAFPLAEASGNLAAEAVIFDGLAARRVSEGFDEL